MLERDKKGLQEQMITIIVTLLSEHSLPFRRRAQAACEGTTLLTLLPEFLGRLNAGPFFIRV
ncbi:hypothetical protein B6S08_11890 [Oceanimonas doudoroffii]|uniref:Uncharacterized protein n=1 Tax=Oceanimonas doudoroffii TaxID=84158 RepID=A0A233RE37_9GAMM|nr:hypothetical protein B6S08_11890 [Oceanimonas doudoroffii]